MPGPIVVLGATGRIGQALRIVWREDFPELETVWSGRRAAEGVDAVVDPVGNSEGLRRLISKAEVVLSLAGPVPGAADNMAAHAGIAEAILASAGNARVLLMSSAAIYGRMVPPLTEEGPVVPESAYGRAKLEMEQAATGRLGVSCLRLGNVAGADALLGKVGTEEVRLDTWPDGATPVRSYIGPVTLARVLAALCILPELPPVLNLAAPQPVSMAALLDAAGIGWKPVPAPPGAIRDVVLDTGRLERLVDFLPEASDPATMVAEWQQMREVWR